MDCPTPPPTKAFILIKIKVEPNLLSNKLKERLPDGKYSTLQKLFCKSKKLSTQIYGMTPKNVTQGKRQAGNVKQEILSIQPTTV